MNCGCDFTWYCYNGSSFARMLAIIGHIFFIPLIPFVGILILIFHYVNQQKVEVPLNNVDNLKQ